MMSLLSLMFTLCSDTEVAESSRNCMICNMLLRLFFWPHELHAVFILHSCNNPTPFQYQSYLCLPTNLHVPAYLPMTYPPTCLPIHLPTYIYLLTYLSPYLPTYDLLMCTCLPTYLPTYMYQPAYLPMTYVPTLFLQGRIQIQGMWYLLTIDKFEAFCTK